MEHGRRTGALYSLYVRSDNRREGCQIQDGAVGEHMGFDVIETQIQGAGGGKESVPGTCAVCSAERLMSEKGEREVLCECLCMPIHALLGCSLDSSEDVTIFRWTLEEADIAMISPHADVLSLISLDRSFAPPDPRGALTRHQPCQTCLFG
jgi:hypothetical protein